MKTGEFVYVLVDRFCIMSYTDITTDRENSRFASMGAESMFSLFFYKQYMRVEILPLIITFTERGEGEVK